MAKERPVKQRSGCLLLSVLGVIVLLILLAHQIMLAQHSDIPYLMSSAEREDAMLARAYDNHDFRGAALIAQNGQVHIAKGYGLADENQHVPNTADTRFNLPGVSMSVIALGILILQEHGKLSVQDHLCKFISDCPKAWQKITLHQLLIHVAGFPSAQEWPQNTPALSSMIEAAARFKTMFATLRNPPGRDFSLSYAGYVILGYVAERASNQPIAPFLREAIFDPLGMKDSGYSTDLPHVPDHATGYRNWDTKASYVPNLLGAGAVYSTINDLYRLDQEVFVKHTLLSKAAYQAMFTPYTGCALQVACHYGYGWLLAGNGQPYEISQSGASSGYLVSNAFYPQSNTILIFLSNAEPSDGTGGSNLEKVKTELKGIVHY